MALQGTEAQLSWDIPADDGGSAITGYTVTSNPDSFTCTTATTSCIIYDLVVGQTYTFTVTATNPVGISNPSSPTNEITVSTAPPGIPRNPSLTTASDNQIDISWEAPLETGGSDITNYKIEYRVTDSLTGSWLSATDLSSQMINLVPNIVNGNIVPIENHPYQIQIQASLDGSSWFGFCGGALELVGSNSCALFGLGNQWELPSG